MNRKATQAERVHAHDARSVAPSETSAAWIADFGRQQLAVAAAGSQAVLRGIEAMRKIQEQTAREVTREHAAVAEQLRGNIPPGQVLQVQGELLRKDLVQASAFWQQMAAAAMEMNSEILGCTVQLVDTEALLAAAHGRLPLA
jgi:hypothetical protein